MVFIVFPIMSPVSIINAMKRSINSLKSSNKFRIGVIMVVMANTFVVHKYSLTHPFLDSDNRHYAQKFYKYIITHQTRKFLMVPFYSLSMVIVYEVLKQTINSKISAYLFWFIFCSSLTLILTPLFELRYFIIPWYILALEINEVS